MLTRTMETDPAPLLARHFKVVARAGQIDGIAVDVPGQSMQLLAFKAAACDFIGKCQPACRINIGRLEDGVDLVFRLQSLGDNLELQVADRAQQQRPTAEVLEDLDRPLFTEFLARRLEPDTP